MSGVKVLMKGEGGVEIPKCGTCECHITQFICECGAYLCYFCFKDHRGVKGLVDDSMKKKDLNVGTCCLGVEPEWDGENPEDDCPIQYTVADPNGPFPNALSSSSFPSSSRRTRPQTERQMKLIEEKKKKEEKRKENLKIQREEKKKSKNNFNEKVQPPDSRPLESPKDLGPLISSPPPQSPPAPLQKSTSKKTSSSSSSQSSRKKSSSSTSKSKKNFTQPPKKQPRKRKFEEEESEDQEESEEELDHQSECEEEGHEDQRLSLLLTSSQNTTRGRGKGKKNEKEEGKKGEEEERAQQQKKKKEELKISTTSSNKGRKGRLMPPNLQQKEYGDVTDIEKMRKKPLNPSSFPNEYISLSISNPSSVPPLSGPPPPARYPPSHVPTPSSLLPPFPSPLPRPPSYFTSTSSLFHQLEGNEEEEYEKYFPNEEEEMKEEVKRANQKKEIEKHREEKEKKEKEKKDKEKKQEEEAKQLREEKEKNVMDIVMYEIDAEKLEKMLKEMLDQQKVAVGKEEEEKRKILQKLLEQRISEQKKKEEKEKKEKEKKEVEEKELKEIEMKEKEMKEKEMKENIKESHLQEKIKENEEGNEEEKEEEKQKEEEEVENMRKLLVNYNIEQGGDEEENSFERKENVNNNNNNIERKNNEEMEKESVEEEDKMNIDENKIQEAEAKSNSSEESLLQKRKGVENNKTNKEIKEVEKENESEEKNEDKMIIEEGKKSEREKNDDEEVIHITPEEHKIPLPHHNADFIVIDSDVEEKDEGSEDKDGDDEDLFFNRNGEGFDGGLMSDKDDENDEEEEEEEEKEKEEEKEEEEEEISKRKKDFPSSSSSQRNDKKKIRKVVKEKEDEKEENLDRAQELERVKEEKNKKKISIERKVKIKEGVELEWNINADKLRKVFFNPVKCEDVPNLEPFCKICGDKAARLANAIGSQTRACETYRHILTCHFEELLKYPKGFFKTSNKETIRIIQRFWRENSLEKKVIDNFPISFSSGEESKEEGFKNEKHLKRKRSDEEVERNVKMKKEDVPSSSSLTCPIEKYWKSLASSSSSSSSSSQTATKNLPYIFLRKRFKDTELESLKRICSQIDKFKKMDGGYYIPIQNKIPDGYFKEFQEKIGKEVLEMKDPKTTPAVLIEVEYDQAWHMDQPFHNCFTVLIYLEDGHSAQFLNAPPLPHNVVYPTDPFKFDDVSQTWKNYLKMKGWLLLGSPLTLKNCPFPKLGPISVFGGDTIIFRSDTIHRGPSSHLISMGNRKAIFFYIFDSVESGGPSCPPQNECILTPWCLANTLGLYEEESSVLNLLQWTAFKPFDHIMTKKKDGKLMRGDEMELKRMIKMVRNSLDVLEDEYVPSSSSSSSSSTSLSKKKPKKKEN